MSGKANFSDILGVKKVAFPRSHFFEPKRSLFCAAKSLFLTFIHRKPKEHNLDKPATATQSRPNPLSFVLGEAKKICGEVQRKAAEIGKTQKIRKIPKRPPNFYFERRRRGTSKFTGSKKRSGFAGCARKILDPVNFEVQGPLLSK